MNRVDQLSNSGGVIRWAEGLLCEDFLELSVVLVREALPGRLFHYDPHLLGFADRAAAGARHAPEDRVFRGLEIDLERNVRSVLEAEVGELVRGEEPILQLEVQTAKRTKGKADERLRSLAAANAVLEVESHIRGRPARERAAEDAHAEAADDQPGEVADDLVLLIEQGRDERLRILSPADELEPLSSLEDEPVVEGVEPLPVDLVELETLEPQHRAPSVRVIVASTCKAASIRGASRAAARLAP